jgi:hypothetical protein
LSDSQRRLLSPRYQIIPLRVTGQEIGVREHHGPPQPATIVVRPDRP